MGENTMRPARIILTTNLVFVLLLVLGACATAGKAPAEYSGENRICGDHNRQRGRV